MDENSLNFIRRTEENKNLVWDFRKTIVTTQATILGISMSLLGFLKAGPSIWLKWTWILEIASIIIGFYLFRIYIKKEKRDNVLEFIFNENVDDINNKLKNGQLKQGSNELATLTIAAMIQRFPESNKTFKQDTPPLLESSKEKLKMVDMVRELSLWEKIEFWADSKLSFIFNMAVIFSMITLFISVAYLRK